MEEWQHQELHRRTGDLISAFLTVLGETIRGVGSEPHDPGSPEGFLRTLDGNVRDRFDDWGLPLEDYQAALAWVNLLREQVEDPSYFSC